MKQQPDKTSDLDLLNSISYALLCLSLWKRKWIDFGVLNISLLQGSPYFTQIDISQNNLPQIIR